MTSNSEIQFVKRSSDGHTSKQKIHQHELVIAIMKKGWESEKKIWWFAYELMGFWEIDGSKYFMSYKASTRVSELANEGLVESRKTEGKLHLYALNQIIIQANDE